MKAYRFRIKDCSKIKRLKGMAVSVNICWNFCNETQKKAIGNRCARVLKDGKSIPNFLSAYEFSPLMKGATKELGIHSDTVQAVAEQYVCSRKTHKKRWLRWRSKKNLGWIPFKANVQISDDQITYMKHTFRFWKSREIEGKMVTGSFAEDSRGRWYVNIIVRDYEDRIISEPNIVGIDLGIKNLATRSDGIKYGASRYFRRYERNLSLAQKDRKFDRCKAIRSKIKNSRLDFAHKVSHEITRDNSIVIVGNVSPSKLAKTKFSKSVLDAGWGQFKNLLQYKAIARKGIYVEVDESFTSSTCSKCEIRSPPGSPKGLKGLSIREWVCGNCLAVHDRDINAARNILRLGYQSLTLE